MSFSRVYLIAILFSYSGVSAYAAAPQKLDLHQTLQFALSHSPDYDTAVRTEHNARLGEKNAWATLFPQVDAQASHQYEDIGGGLGSTATHAPWSNQLTLSVSENLYDNGVSARAVQIAELALKSGKLALERTRAQILVKVAKAFYDYSVAAASLDITREQIESVRKQFHIIEGRYRQGASSSRDFLRIKAQLQQAEIGLTNAKFTVEDAAANLRVLLGEKADFDFVPVDVQTPSLGVEPPALVPEQTLDYRIAKIQDDISDLKYRSVIREDLPRLSLKSSYTYGQPEYLGPRYAPLDNANWDLRASLVLDYSLWDWGLRRRNVEVADNQRHIEYDTQSGVRINTEQAIRRLRVQFDLLRESLRESQLILKSNENVYSSLSRDYQAANVSYIELITALNDLYSTRIQLMTLQSNFLKARADLAYYQGNIDEVLAAP